MQVSVEISDETIMGLLCNAFEGGSNYWYTDIEQLSDPTREPLEGEEDFHWSQSIPVRGGVIVVEVYDEHRGKRSMHRLDRYYIESGLKLMQLNSPRHFANVINGDDDAETGDVFLQYCLFGEIVYG